jgi:hypothetical protein
MKESTYYRRKRELYDLLGNKCVMCGDEKIATLQIDHVNGDGFKDKNAYATGASYLKNLLALSLTELKSRYQLLCPTCNWAKRIRNNENRNKNSGKIPDEAYYAVGDAPPDKKIPAALTPLLEAALLLIKEREKK